MHAVMIFERTIHAVFYRYGKVVATCPWPFLFLPVLIAVALTTAAVLKQKGSVLQLQTTYDLDPSDVFHQTEWNQTGENRHRVVWWTIFFIGRNGSTVIHPETISYIMSTHQHITSDGFSIKMKDQTTVTYQAICNHSDVTCNEALSENIKAAIGILKSETFRNNAQIKLKYPVIEAFGQQVLLIPNFCGATYSETTGKLENFRVFKLTYVAKIEPGQYEEIGPKILAYTRHLGAWLREESDSIAVNATLETWYGLDEANNASVREILPRLAVSWLLMAIFTVISCARKDCVKSKCCEAFGALVSAVLAMGSAYGTICMAGIAISSVDVIIIPLLVLILGINGGFLLINAWHHSDAALLYKKRLALSVADAALPITISALVILISLGVGIFTQSSPINRFCILAIFGVGAEYLFQMTLFISIFAVISKREYIGTCSACCLKSRQQQPKRETEIFAIASAQNRINEMNIGNHHIFSRLAGLLFRPMPALVVSICLTGILIASIYGSTAINEINLNSRNLLRDGDPLQPIYRLKERLFQSEAVLVTVRIDNPPDFNNFTQLQSFLEMVHSLESSVHTNAQEQTLLWLRSYLQYLNRIRTADFYEPLCGWLSVPSEKHWLSDIEFINVPELTKCSDAPQIRRFSFQIAYRNLTRLDDRVYLTQLWTGIKTNFSRLNLTILTPLSANTIELHALPVAEILIIGIAMLTLLVLSVLLIPHAICIFLTVFSSLCIGVGAIGIMGIFGAELDQVSAIVILTSVGLSTIFTGHVTYMYHCIDSVAVTGRRRIVIETLSKTAWPSLQTAIGALLGVAMLGTISTYMAKTIFQTFCILSVLGAFHSIAVLPMLLWILG